MNALRIPFRKWNKSGQSAVEFALTFLIFLAIMVALSDMVRICYHWVTLQYAVNEGARFGSLGGPPGRETAIEGRVVDIANDMGVNGVSVSFVDEEGGGTAGGPLSFYRLKAQTTVSLNVVSALLRQFTGDYSGDFVVSAETIIRNEPFA